MFSASLIDQHIIQAYLETHFHVTGSAPFTMKIGIACENLTPLYKQTGTSSCTFITACNPFSQNFDEAVNLERQAQFAQELTRRGIHFVEGIGQHPSGDWPGEPSYLAFGLSLDAAKILGETVEQNAIVWCDESTVPQLVLLR